MKTYVPHKNWLFQLILLVDSGKQSSVTIAFSRLTVGVCPVKWWFTLEDTGRGPVLWSSTTCGNWELSSTPTIWSCRKLEGTSTVWCTVYSGFLAVLWWRNKNTRLCEKNVIDGCQNPATKVCKYRSTGGSHGPPIRQPLRRISDRWAVGEHGGRVGTRLLLKYKWCLCSTR